MLQKNENRQEYTYIFDSLLISEITIKPIIKTFKIIINGNYAEALGKELKEKLLAEGGRKELSASVHFMDGGLNIYVGNIKNKYPLELKKVTDSLYELIEKQLPSFSNSKPEIEEYLKQQGIHPEQEHVEQEIVIAVTPSEKPENKNLIDVFQKKHHKNQFENDQNNQTVKYSKEITIETKRNFNPLPIPTCNTEDLREMFRYLSPSVFQESLDTVWRGFSHRSTQYGNGFRTTFASFIHPNMDYSGGEDVCRTTISTPLSKVRYIERREEHDTHHNPRSERSTQYGKTTHSIAFDSKENAEAFVELLYSTPSIVQQQKKLDDDHLRNACWRNGKAKAVIATSVNHLVNVETYAFEVLSILANSNNCLKEAIDQFNEPLRQDSPGITSYQSSLIDSLSLSMQKLFVNNQGEETPEKSESILSSLNQN